MPRKPRKNPKPTPVATPPALPANPTRLGPPKRITPAGRPSVLSKLPTAKYSQIIDLIRLGVTMQAAAGAMGVAPETFNRWMVKGRAGESKLYKRFYKDVVEAACFARTRNEIQVSKEDPKAWLLGSPAARFTPEIPQWGEKSTIVLEGSEENPVRMAVDQALPVSEEDLIAMLKVYEECGFITITETGRQALSSREELSGEDVLEGEFNDNVHEGNGHA